MANTDVTRHGVIAQKKVRSVLAVKINDELFEDNDVDIAEGTENLLVAVLPPNALIVRAYVNVKTVSDAATTATAALGTTEGGAELLAATDLLTAAIADSLVAMADTGTGQEIYLQTVLAGAVTTLGETEVIVEYIEYEKNNGEYTQFAS